MCTFNIPSCIIIIMFFFSTSVFRSSLTPTRHIRLKVLNRLGLENCFEGIIGFETLNPHYLEPVDCMTESPILCKPSVKAIEAAIPITNVDPEKTIRLDALRKLEDPHFYFFSQSSLTLHTMSYKFHSSDGSVISVSFF